MISINLTTTLPYVTRYFVNISSPPVKKDAAVMSSANNFDSGRVGNKSADVIAGVEGDRNILRGLKQC